MVGYKEFMGNLTFTATECSEYYSDGFLVLGIFFIVVVIVLGAIAVILIERNVNYKKFVVENKLQEKYQEWKKLNKGL